MISRLIACLPVLLLTLGGCQTFTPTPPVQLDTASVSPSADTSPLAKVLRQSVTEDGEIIRSAVESNRELLLQQLRLLAVSGPTVTPDLYPTEEHALAYWYNARAAWSLYLGLDAGFKTPSTIEAITSRKLPLDGRRLTLDDLDALLAERDDFRIVVAAPGVSLQRAPLPLEPFSADDIRRRIDERFNAFIDDPERLQIDIARQMIVYPPVLWRMRDRILQRFAQRYGAHPTTLRSALLFDVSGSPHRRLQDAIGYRETGARSLWSYVPLIED